jgi:hypothetical protein
MGFQEAWTGAGTFFPAPSLDPDLAALLPVIRRARDFRLYTAGGKRLLDLWLAGGYAVLGHTPPALLRELKNTAARGLFAPFPGPGEGRLVKALSLLFPGRICRLYAGDAALCRALDQAGCFPADYPPDPAFGPPPPGPPPVLSLWRPFLPGASPLAVPGDIPVLIPLLPLPWPGAPQIAAILPGHAGRFPPSQCLSPVILAAACRAVYDLIAVAGKQPLRDGAFPKIDAALSRSNWRRRGIYLTRRDSPGGDARAALFRRFLEAGFLLPPDPRLPLILPAALSPGEEAHLAALLREDPEA